MCFPFTGACISLGREKMLIFNLCLVYQATLIALYWWPGIFLFAALLSANFTAMLFFSFRFLVKILGIGPVFSRIPVKHTPSGFSILIALQTAFNMFSVCHVDVVSF